MKNMKRALRRKKTFSHFEKEKKIAKYCGGVDLSTMDDRQIGRFKNHSYFDCGNPQCGLCGKNEKRNRSLSGKGKGLTFQERKSLLYFKETG